MEMSIVEIGESKCLRCGKYDPKLKKYSLDKCDDCRVLGFDYNIATLEEYFSGNNHTEEHKNNWHRSKDALKEVVFVLNKIQRPIVIK